MNKIILILIFIFIIFSVSDVSPQSKIYLFYSPNNCKDCFRKFKLHSDSLIINNKVDSILVIGRTLNQVLSKKLLKRDISKLMPDYTIRYEFIEEQDPWPPNNLKGGLFGKYNVSLTPAVLVVTDGKETFISYEALNHNNFNIKIILDNLKICQ